MNWISVKDKLPDDDGDVIACDGKNVFIANCEGGYWVVYLPAEDNCREPYVVKVAYWMPLPEPPEVEDVQG